MEYIFNTIHIHFLLLFHQTEVLAAQENVLNVDLLIANPTHFKEAMCVNFALISTAIIELYWCQQIKRLIVIIH